MAKSSSIISNILKSIFFDKASKQADKTIKDPSNLFKLLRDVMSKTQNYNGQDTSGFIEKIKLFVRLVKAYALGEYRQVPWKTITRIVAVLIYFISPIDLIPDFIVGIGLTDDIALVVWLFGAIAEDLEAFRIWEKREKTIPIG